MADISSLKNALFSLVSTRLIPPHLPSGSIHRDRLLQRLNVNYQDAGILAVITAPAGYGKSTLLAQSNQRYREAGWNTAWLNLEENDNDEEGFLRYLSEAISQLIGHDAVTSVKSAGKEWNLSSGLNLITDMINSVSLTDRYYVLFLDDYHVIHEKNIHQIIQNLIAHLPDNLNLIIGSRTQLPFPMARLRASNRLVTIEMDELRFNQDEAQHLFKETNRLDIDARKLDQFYQRTGGWPAVLQLAAISFRDAGDPQKFIDNFSGSTEPVSEFLLEEIIALLPEDFASLLIRSAITERLCYPLCREITENDQFSRELYTIGRERFLIQQLDNEGYWFRFHPLFRNFLLKQMELKFQDEKHILHQRASSWYEEQGMIAEATQHAISGGHEDHALELLEVQGMRFINHGYLSLLLSLIRQLPDNFLHGSLELLIQLAWVEVLNNHVERARHLLTEIKQIMEKQEIIDEEEWLKVYALEVPICFFEDDYIEGKKMVNNWLRKAPENSILSASLSVISSYIHLSEYQYDKALKETSWLLNPDDSLEFAYSHCFAACAHGLINLYRGFPYQGINCMNDAMKWLGQHVDSNSQTITVMKPILAACYYQVGDSQQAVQLMQEGVSSLNTLASPDHLLSHIPVRTRLLYTNEGYHEALDYLLESKILAEERNWHRVEACILHERVRLYIELGSVDQARAVFEQGVKKLKHDLASAAPLASQSREWMKIAEARLVHAEGNTKQALSMIKPFIEEFSTNQRTLRTMELHVLQGRFLAESGQADKAREKLLEALIPDEEDSILQLFRDEGNAVLQVLTDMRLDGENRLYPEITLKKLANILEPVSASDNFRKPETIDTDLTENTYQSIIEPLTKRELVTMKKVAEGYSNKEISDALYISINTVKSHIYSAFSKLGVTRRTQAVRRLKELGILH